MRGWGWSAMRLSTSWNQTKGSTLTSLQVATKLASTDAVSPPRLLPKKVQLPADGPGTDRAHGVIIVDR